jgi:hypothetical protein
VKFECLSISFAKYFFTIIMKFKSKGVKGVCTVKKDNFSYKLWQWILNLIILVPVIALGVHFVVDKYEYTCKEEIKCSEQELNNIESYQDREWRRLLITEILVILGSMLKIILRHRKNKII